MWLLSSRLIEGMRPADTKIIENYNCDGGSVVGGFMEKMGLDLI